MGDRAGGDTQGTGQALLSVSLFPCRHCIDLFLDFVNIFRDLLMILGVTEVGDSPQGMAWRRGDGVTAPGLSSHLSCRTRRRQRSEAAPGRGGAVPIQVPVSPPCPSPVH